MWAWRKPRATKMESEYLEAELQPALPDKQTSQERKCFCKGRSRRPPMNKFWVIAYEQVPPSTLAQVFDKIESSV